ncbi:MAG: hypothetical protein HQM02_11780 [Magnetococcales bacterium]|nr:hypothetical protein [Magnetococcales bacterium]
MIGPIALGAGITRLREQGTRERVQQQEGVAPPMDDEATLTVDDLGR